MRQRDYQRQQKKAQRAIEILRGGGRRDRVTDEPLPPDNPEFESYPKAFQDLIAKRFESGITRRRDNDDCAEAGAKGCWTHLILRDRARAQLAHERARHEQETRTATLQMARKRAR
jgi:hypothetical protein